MFAIFEPTTLPVATSPSPRIVDSRLTPSSGALVPRATTVSPTASGVRPMRRASADEQRTNVSAPNHSRTLPAIR